MFSLQSLKKWTGNINTKPLLTFLTLSIPAMIFLIVTYRTKKADERKKKRIEAVKRDVGRDVTSKLS